jgi:hypothetical protein
MKRGAHIHSASGLWDWVRDDVTLAVLRITGAALVAFVLAMAGPARSEIWMDSPEALKAFGQPAGGSRYAGQITPKRKSTGVRVASLGGTYTPTLPKKSLTGGGTVTWIASAGCLNSGLRAIVQEVASTFGPVKVTSTCRSKAHNRRVGGAPRSYHLTGDAVDFRVQANVSAVASFLKSRVGGYQNKGGGLFHIDTGPRRPMG